jgi:hypothetical protein
LLGVLLFDDGAEWMMGHTYDDLCLCFIAIAGQFDETSLYDDDDANTYESVPRSRGAERRCYP